MSEPMTEAQLDALTDTQTVLAQRLPMLSVHPRAATWQDIADMAAELMDCRCAIVQLRARREGTSRCAFGI